MSQDRLAIIADDFTGANDSGLQLRKQGASVAVVLDVLELDKALDEFDVVVIDTESRADDEGTAFDKVSSAAGQLSERGIDRLYKKLDSTMRGNIGAEIDAAMTGSNADVAIVAPALPVLGRTTENGICLLNNTPIDQTEFARDPKTPVRSAHVPRVVSEQTIRKVATIGLEAVRRDSESLSKDIERLRDDGAEIIVVDAVTDEDLAAIGQVLPMLKGKVLAVGSTGFAVHLAVEGSARPVERSACKSIVVMAGSVSKVTRTQIEHALDAGCANVIDVDSEAVLSVRRDEEIERIVREAAHLSAGDRPTVIRSARSREDVARATQSGRTMGWDSGQTSGAIAAFHGMVARALWEAVGFDGLVLTGGDTAIHVTRALWTAGTIIDDEVLPGIPCGRFIGDASGKVHVVTKAGGFGETDALVRILDYLAGGPP